MASKPIHSPLSGPSHGKRRIYAPDPELRSAEAELAQARDRFLWTVLGEEISTYFSQILEKDYDTRDAILVFYSVHSGRSFPKTGQSRIKSLLSSIKSIVDGRIYDGFIQYISVKLDLYVDVMSLSGVSVGDNLLKNALKIQFGLSAEQIEKVSHDIQGLISQVLEGPAAALTLPSTPPLYGYAPRMEGGIVRYLQDNWAPYIEAGLLTRPELRRIDPKAEDALSNFLRGGGVVPDHLHVLTKSEVLDRELADPEAVRRASALSRTARARAARTKTP